MNNFLNTVFNSTSLQNTDSQDVDEWSIVFQQNQAVIDRIHSIRLHVQGRRNTRHISSSPTRLLQVRSYTLPLFDFNVGEYNVMDSLNDLIDNFDFTYNLEDVKKVISQADFDKLVHIVVDSSTTDSYSDQCNICLDNCELGQTIIRLNCKHYFHIECIKAWLTKQSTKCPICRQEVVE